MTDLDPEDASRDLLCGDWHIYQLRGGHRFSTDDILVAWLGALSRPDARNVLDLGAGIGSVGLMTLYQLPSYTRLTMLEAQKISHELCRKAVGTNGLTDRVRVRLGDLRDPAQIPEEEMGGYDLVTGSPPYFPLGTGVVSPHPQRAACRFELRGDISDYCRAAERALTVDGVFAFVHAAEDPRPERAIDASGLTLLSRQDVVFRSGRNPVISLFLVGREGHRIDRDPIVVRDETGSNTPQYQSIRRQMGAPIGVDVR